MRFPPHWQHVLIPTAPPAATALGMTLYTASRPVPVLAHQVLWWTARISRGRLVPGRRESWAAPLPADTFTELWREWTAMIGRTPEAVAVYKRPQSERSGLTLLLCAGDSSALVRVRADAATLVRERQISEVAATVLPSAFRVPHLIDAGTVDGWSWVGYELIARRPHLPVRAEVRGLYDQISELVESVVERRLDVPPHWRGAHGDLTPWNLRRSHSGVWLIDWEDAGWAPPGADAVYFRAVVAAMRRRPVSVMSFRTEHREALRYWVDTVRRRTDNDPLDRRVLGLLSTA